MRAHHVIAIIAVLLVGLGARVFFFSYPAAQADIDAKPSASMNVLQMHIEHPNMKDLPAQKMHDMTFVFDGD